MADLDKSDILDYIRNSPTPQTKRDIARAFKVKGGENRVALKQILKSLKKDGAITKQAGGAFTAPQGLPAVGTVEVTDISVDGDIVAKIVDWDDALLGEAQRIEIMPDKKHYPHMAEGKRALVRFERVSDDVYEARIIKPLDTERGRVIGVVKYNKHGPLLVPTDKKARNDYAIHPSDLNGANEGDLALAEVQPSKGLRLKKVRIIEVLGKQGDPKAISLISLHEAGLNEDWPAAVTKETKGMKVPDTKGREDLRNVPLMTIDGADARDFDDAVFAEKDDSVEGGGYHLIVAIADVAYYVRPGSALDTEAQRRGNSTYFPDRVIPMLPEALSNDLCSLRPDEPRACMVAHMWIDKEGNLKKHKFTRGLMKSHKRLTYEEVQHIYDTKGEDGDEMAIGPILGPINTLYEVFGILDHARQKRGALDLDMPEKQIVINENNEMTGVKVRQRLDSHKLIEEFMILANVAAAQAIEAKRAPDLFPCVYRIHDTPSTDKLDSVREFLASFDLNLPKGQVTRSAQINGILQQASKLPYSHLISTVILRSQSQAVYAAENIGHFGLALQKYAHFTSPIRRYADLLVHRALISAYKLGPGGLNEAEIARIDEICQHISQTERTSMEAERNAVDRFTAAYLSEKVGAEFSGRISGVTRFGLFVTLDESNADGLVPMRSMEGDFFVHDEEQHALIGRRTGTVFRLGAQVTVRLKEADGLTGSTVLELCGDSLNGAEIPGMVFKTKKKPFRHDQPRGRKGKPKSGKPQGKKNSYKNKGSKKTSKKTTPKHKRKQKQNKKD